MSNLAKITEDINVDKFNKVSNQLEDQAERIAKLMEINKILTEKTLEFNAVNNANYTPKVSNKTKEEDKNEEIDNNSDSDKKYSPNETQKNQVEKIINKVKKDENKTTDKKVSKSIDLKDIVKKEENENNETKTEETEIDEESIKETINEKIETEETKWWIKIDLQQLKSTKVSGNDSEDEIEAKKLLNEAKKDDEDWSKIDLSKIM